MTAETLINGLFPVLFGFAGLYLAVHGWCAVRRRNREIERKWRGE